MRAGGVGVAVCPQGGGSFNPAGSEAAGGHGPAARQEGQRARWAPGAGGALGGRDRGPGLGAHRAPPPLFIKKWHFIKAVGHSGIKHYTI